MSRRKVIISYEKLSEELQEQFQKTYKAGLTGKVERFTKPNGESISIAPLMTDDTYYMVKVNDLLRAIASKFDEDDNDSDDDDDNDYSAVSSDDDDDDKEDAY